MLENRGVSLGQVRWTGNPAPGWSPLAQPQMPRTQWVWKKGPQLGHGSGKGTGGLTPDPAKKPQGTTLVQHGATIHSLSELAHFGE